MSTVTQSISVTIPEVKDFTVNHIIKCGGTTIEIEMYDWEKSLWRPTASHVEKMDMTPRAFEEVLFEAKECAVRLETSHLLHLKLVSILGEN